jgi:hypothetical protein
MRTPHTFTHKQVIWLTHSLFSILFFVATDQVPAVCANPTPLHAEDSSFQTGSVPGAVCLTLGQFNSSLPKYFSNPIHFNNCQLQSSRNQFVAFNPHCAHGFRPFVTQSSAISGRAKAQAVSAKVRMRRVSASPSRTVGENIGAHLAQGSISSDASGDESSADEDAALSLPVSHQPQQSQQLTHPLPRLGSSFAGVLRGREWQPVGSYSHALTIAIAASAVPLYSTF